MKKIPATIVTGFLGSGKTTLLQNLLRNAQGLRVAVVVNEFGAVDVDTDLIRQCSLGCEDTEAAEVQGEIYELANGCICCTVQEEFLPVLEQLVARRDNIDHILIETSGLALPKPLVQAFSWPEIRNSCTVDAVITVVDSAAVAAGRFADDPEAVELLRRQDPSLDHEPALAELFSDQLIAADLVVLNKRDLIDESTLDQVQQQVRAQLPREVKILPAVSGQLDLGVLLGMNAQAEAHIEHIHTHHDHHHAQDEEHEHVHELFESVIVTLPPMDAESLLSGLEALVARHTIYRIKGHAVVPDKPMRMLVQGVGKRFNTQFDRRWRADETRQTRLVVIGKHLDENVLTQELSG